MEEVDEHKSSLVSKQERGVLYVGEKKYAVGLTWLAFDLEPNSAVLKQRLNKFNADYFCTRQTIANQQGFGYIKKGHKPGMAAAASIAADTLIGDWHGVFVADNGWWYVAVHSDNISPGGDQFFLTEEEAFNCFTEQSNLYNWPRSYAPATWNIDNANPDIPLDRLLEDDAQVPKLRAATFDAIFGGKQRRNFAIFIIIIIAAVVFSALVLPKLAKKAKMERDMTIKSNIVVPAVINAPPKLSAVTSIDQADGGFKLPQPSKVIEYCSYGFSEIVEPLPGWEFNGVICNILDAQNTVSTTVEWRRGSGSFELAKGYLREIAPNIQTGYNGSDVITGRLFHGTLSTVSQPVKPLERALQILLVYERFGGLGTLRVDDVYPKDTEVQAQGIDRIVNAAQPKVKPPFLKMSLNTTMPPDVLSLYFDIPGLKLKSINWGVQRKSWTYEAEILYQSRQFFDYYNVEPYNDDK